MTIDGGAPKVRRTRWFLEAQGHGIEVQGPRWRDLKRMKVKMKGEGEGGVGGGGGERHEHGGRAVAMTFMFP